MIDPLVWLTRISPKILEFRFSLHMVKDDWPPQGMTDQDLTKNFQVQIWPAHSEGWVTSPGMTDQDLT